MEARLASIAIHLDSLTAISHLLAPHDAVSNSRDPLYEIVGGPFMELAARLGIKYTIFVVARDLRDAAVASKVRAWHAEGHEIANHSLDHFPHLGDDAAQIAQQVHDAHAAIADATGMPPVGFVSPSWSMSGDLLEKLIALGYEYDASLFPSLVMLLVQLRLRLKSHPRARAMLPFPRRDLRGSLFGRRQPYAAEAGAPWRPARSGAASIIEIPLPTSRIRLPMWHTMRFVLPRGIFLRTLDDALRTCRGFYYVMHPIDLLDPDTHLHGLPTDFARIERVGVPISVKRRAVREALEYVTERRRIVTMRELAASFRLSAPAAAR